MGLGDIINKLLRLITASAFAMLHVNAIIVQSSKLYEQLTQPWAVCKQGRVWLQLFGRFWGFKDGATHIGNKLAQKLDY